MRRLAIVAATIALAAVSAEAAQAEAAPDERLLVMPFDRVTRDARIFWIGEAAAILLADDLNGLGVHAITREERTQAFERLQVPPVASLTDATVIRIGQLVGASQVVIGRVELTKDILSVHARSIALEAGRVQVEVSEQGPLPELFAIVERIARRLAPSVKSVGEAERPHPPVAAFENYVKGLLAETPATAIGYPQHRSDASCWLRSRPAGAVGGLHRTGRAPARTGGGAVGCLRLRVGATCAVSIGVVATSAEEIRRSVRHVQGAGGRAAHGGCSQQPWRRAVAAAPRRRRPAAPPTTSIERPRPIPRTPTTSSTSATPTGSIATRSRDLLAPRSRPARIPATATRTSSSARRWR